MGESKRERSRAYPRITVEEAVGLLVDIRAAIGTGPFSREAVAESMGLSPGSGYANSKTAALVHYGLLQRGGSSYGMTELAERVLHPTHDEERNEAIADAVKQPSLFRSLFERFEGKSLPNLLSNILARDFGISSKQSNDVANVFRNSTEFSGLLRNGILHGTIESVSSQSDPANQSSVSEHDQVGQSNSVSMDAISGNSLGSSVTSQQYQIPLKGGQIAILLIPRSVNKRDLDRIKQWIDLMEDALVEDGDE